MKRHAAALSAGALIVAWCAGCAEEPRTQPSAWPGAESADLVATGMALRGGSASGDLVVDGAGMAWADGAWAVERIDPVTGTATVWDAASDAAFASVRRLAAGQPSGAWLIEAGTARLFDGERFAVVLALPDEYRQDDDPGSTVAELLQVGDRVYVAGRAGVARWSAGTWTPIGADRLVAAGHLAVDTLGEIWAGGTLADGSGGDPTGAVVRLDGDTWTAPGAGRGAPIGEVGDVAADPRGGIWTTSRAEGTVDHGVFRFDGTSWQKAGDGGYAGDLGVTSAGEVWAMVGGGDGLGGSGTSIAGRLGSDGAWQSFSSDVGAPIADEGSSADLAVSGDRVLMVHEEGLLGLSGERFEPIWDDPAAVLLPAFGLAADAVIAIGAEEVWLPATPMPARAGAGTGGAPGAGLMRYRDGAWQRIGPDIAGDTPPRPVLASDGAIWEVTRFGELARVVGDEASVVVPGHEFQGPAALAPAGGGAVWAVVDGDVVRIAPEGARTSIGRPEGVARIDPYNPIAALGDDAVWVIGQKGDVHLWDGQEWSDLPAVPGTSGSVATLLAVPDGSLWLLDGMDMAGTSTLLRLHEGRWSTGPAGMRGLAAAPDGAVCSMRLDQVDIVCLDAGLTVVRTIPVVGRPVAFGIAPAGAVWLAGEQVARLATGSAG